MSLVLGIDPGSRVTGYGLVDARSKKPVYVASGCIKLKDASMPERMVVVHQSLNQIIEQYRPDTVAIERVFVGKSAGSALKLGHARGVAMLAAALAGLSVSEYAPRTIKQAVAGSGAADKLQVQDMIVRLLALNASPAEDAADALAVALCHVYSARFQQVSKASRA